MRNSILALTILILTTFPTIAQETLPGDACDVGQENYIRQSGGTETGGVVHLMRCDGANWQQYMTFFSSGHAGIGTDDPKAPLHVDGEAIIGMSDPELSCDADTAGAIRYSGGGGDCPAGGAEVGGYCWYYGADNQSCTAVCGGVGEAYNEATRTFAGSDGTDNDCHDVLDALGVAPSPITSPGLAAGCATFEGDRRRYSNSTTAGATWSGTRRACACGDGPEVASVLEYCDGDDWGNLVGDDSGDNLGDHTATQALDMAGHTIHNASGIQIGSTATCGPDEEGTMRYTGGDPPWEFCDGADWVNFKQPRCEDDDIGECYLETDRSESDPDFIASNIADGVNILGVTGSLSGSTCIPDTVTFTPLNNQDTSTDVTSNSVLISGIFGSCYIAANFPTSGSIIVNSVDTGNTVAQVSNGDTISLRAETAPGLGTQVDSDLISSQGVIGTFSTSTTDCPAGAGSQSWTTSGTYTFNVTASMENCPLRLTIGGGGGGGGTGSSGGDGGGIIMDVLLNSTATLNILVGDGGDGGENDSYGSFSASDGADWNSGGRSAREGGGGGSASVVRWGSNIIAIAGGGGGGTRFSGSGDGGRGGPQSTSNLCGQKGFDSGGEGGDGGCNDVGGAGGTDGENGGDGGSASGNGSAGSGSNGAGGSGNSTWQISGGGGGGQTGSRGGGGGGSGYGGGGGGTAKSGFSGHGNGGGGGGYVTSTYLLPGSLSDFNPNNGGNTSGEGGDGGDGIVTIQWGY